jgi:four helix bundle protein
LSTAQRFEDLRVWQNARSLVNRIYDVTKRPPFREDYGLCRQIRDAAVSVMSNIAEGFERGSKNEFTQFLFIARGSAGEVRSDLYSAFDQQYISQSDFDDLLEQYEVLSRQIMSLISYLRGSQYKGDKFREDRAVYEVYRVEAEESLPQHET